MNFAQTMKNDLDSLYNADELGILAVYKDTQIVVLPADDVEVTDVKEFVVSAKSTDTPDIDIGDVFTISGENYKVVNFDYEDKYELEVLIALSRI